MPKYVNDLNVHPLENSQIEKKKSILPPSGNPKVPGSILEQNEAQVQEFAYQIKAKGYLLTPYVPLCKNNPKTRATTHRLLKKCLLQSPSPLRETQYPKSRL